MSISIFDLHFPTESFHLLDIAMVVIDKCQPEIDKKKEKLQYSFSLDIDFGLISQTIDFNTLCISGDRYITLVNDAKKSLSPTKRKGLSIDDVSIPFTIHEYLRLLNDRIRYSLPTIGLVYVSSSLGDSSITVNFTIGANTLEDYKAELIEKLDNQLSFKTYGDIKDVESTMLAKIRSIAIDTKTTNLYIDTQDFGRLFDKMQHPILSKRKTDSVSICDIHFLQEPLELMLYILLIKGYLLSVSGYRGKFKIDINPDINFDILEQEESKKKPIEFNMNTGVIRINGIYIGKLKYESVLYEFFLILYKNQNTFVKTEDLAIELKLLNHKRMPYEILRGYKNDLKSVEGLGDSFVKTYISTESKAFMLKNI